MKALPYITAVLIGATWHQLNLAVALPALALCAWLIYIDSKD